MRGREPVNLRSVNGMRLDDAEWRAFQETARRFGMFQRDAAAQAIREWTERRGGFDGR